MSENNQVVDTAIYAKAIMNMFISNNVDGSDIVKTLTVLLMSLSSMAEEGFTAEAGGIKVIVEYNKEGESK